MGFHFISVVFLSVILLPNLLFYVFKPKDIPTIKKEPIVLTIIENIGRITSFIIPLIYGKQISNQDFNYLTIIMLIFILVYYICWVRYFIKGRKFSLLFNPLWHIPIPMAIFPLLYFLFMSIWIQSLILGIAVVIFAIGHLSISWITYKQLQV